ncbi:AMP-binding protein [Patulibacter sp. SYSU D01012]|uniref:AMP-binding protein n=1 Tax=Patulibacter sp. SYSU D01012 TaxID=2817381 RepID=UPI001B313349|nr:AMP-binding protein [Patulibacter sp. SYSU D01012]
MQRSTVGSVLAKPAVVGRRAREEAVFAAACARAGLLRGKSPAALKAVGEAYVKLGPLGAIFTMSVEADAGRAAAIDDRGTTTFGELDARANAIANAWRDMGLRAGDGVGLMLRNHAGFLEVLFACVKTGAKAILLNTAFSGPQLADVAAREGTRLLVFDDEFREATEHVDAPLGRFRAWTDDPDDASEGTIALLRTGDHRAPAPPERHMSLILLTSGTTGTPKGAARPQPKSLSPFGGPLARIPLRKREVTALPAPIFHATGLIHTLIAVGLADTLILRRRFDPEQTLRDMEEYRATSLIVVPVMLRRLLDAYDKGGRREDLSSLRVIFAAGSQLGGALATRTLDTLGPVLYNLYGSTEVAMATIASPEELRQAPDSVGSPVPGTRVRILDANGHDVAPGETGRIFVGTAMPFQGYTGGGTKPLVDGLMASGDVGHFDEHGLLTIDGRDDDMIVSGGENVFPGELEELLAGHPKISEAAVIGVDDDEFGQRLCAYVVLEEDATLTEDDVRAYAKDNLARYKVPRDVHFLSELPRNPTGKVLKRELVARRQEA